MSVLIFYEKPGCATNSRQKLLLKNAGIEFEARSLLAEKWTTDRLEAFFSGTPVFSWFNRAAPRIKSGEVNPEKISAAQALALMVADPLLIRRPLMERDDWRAVGFNWDELAAKLGIDSETRSAAKGSIDAPLEGCSHANDSAPHCSSPASTISGTRL